MYSQGRNSSVTRVTHSCDTLTRVACPLPSRLASGRLANDVSFFVVQEQSRLRLQRVQASCFCEYWRLLGGRFY